MWTHPDPVSSLSSTTLSPSTGASQALAARSSITTPNSLHGLVLAAPLESTAHLALQFLLTEVSGLEVVVTQGSAVGILCD